MDILSAPLFDTFIAKAQSYADLLHQQEKAALLHIIEKLHCVAISGDDECRKLWFTVERGSIENFGDYDEFLLNEIVENREDFERIWKEDYPDPVKWYHFSVNHYNGEYFINIDNKLTLHIKKEVSALTEPVNLQLILWIEQAVDKCLDWLRKDAAGYNEYINQHLPFSKRLGRILRQQYWKINPEEKGWMLKGLTMEDIDMLNVIVDLSENENQHIILDKMTSGIFFDCCKMGYEANIYLYNTETKPVDLYRKFADGRDFGLTQLDTGSPQAFEEWFDKREWQFGHPWEVCRGGNSTHISLYVDKQANGWRLSLAGKSRVRMAETVRFAIALYKQNIPFKLWDAKEILAMVSGTDYIGIVPEGFIPVYCHSYFPKEDNILDFMNLPDGNRDEIINTVYWYPLEKIRLFQG